MARPVCRWLLILFSCMGGCIAATAQDNCCLVLDASDTNTTVIQTGGFLPLLSRTRPIQFPDVPGTFSLSFTFGFATEELPIDGEILDSMILFLQNTNSGVTTVLFMADASGYGWLPYSSSLFPLFDAALDLTAIDPPDLPITPVDGVALQVTFRVPPALATGGTQLKMMLYDYPNGLNSACWLSQVTVIAPPGELQVPHTNIFRSFGPYRGVFGPTNTTYALTNSGGSKLQWRVSHSEQWLTVSPSDGDLDWGRTTNVTLTVNNRARSMPPGFYTNQVVFFNDSLATNILVRQIELLVIQPAELEVLQPLPTGQFGLQLNAMPFANYRIEAGPDLTSWTAIHTNTTDATSSYIFLEPVTPSHRFYRASFVYP